MTRETEQRSGLRHVGVLFHERGHRTRRLRTQPASFPPPQPHRRRETRSVDQLHPLPAMRMRHDPTCRAAHHHRRPGLDLNPEPPHRRDRHQSHGARAGPEEHHSAGSRKLDQASSRSSKLSGVVTPILEGLDPPHPTDTPTTGPTLTPRSSPKSRFGRVGSTSPRISSSRSRRRTVWYGHAQVRGQAP